MVLLKRMMKITPPQDGRVDGDDDDDGFPLREGSAPGGICPPEGTIAPAQVPPRDGGASSRKSSPDFFQVDDEDIPEGGGQRWAGLRSTQRGAPGGAGAPWWVLSPPWPPSGSSFFQYFLLIPKIIFVKFQVFWSCT